MRNEIIPALIALIGVGVSAAISYVISSRQSSIELQKLRTSLQTELGSKLYEKRLEVYPDLYAQLSTLIKLIESGELISKDLKEVFLIIQDWDTKNSILFSNQAGHIAYEFRQALADLTKSSDEDLQNKLNSYEQMKTLKHKIHELELALKHELGSYHFESPISLKELERFGSYAEAYKVSTQQYVLRRRKR